MSAHTKGPWKAHFGEAYYVTGPDLGRVAMMMNLKGAHGLGGRRSGQESAANCRLIAAAPQLLEALGKAEIGLANANSYERLPTVEQQSVVNALESVRAAIKAAKGEA